MKTVPQGVSSYGREVGERLDGFSGFCVEVGILTIYELIGFKVWLDILNSGLRGHTVAEAFMEEKCKIRIWIKIKRRISRLRSGNGTKTDN